MTITVDRKDLLDALAAVMPATSRSSKSTVARGVRIVSDADGCRIEADNGDLALSAPLVYPPTRKPRATIVNARKLATVVRRGLPAGEVTIVLDPKRPSVAAGSTKVWFEALGDEWPKRSPVVGETLALTADDVATIKRAAVAASDDWARPILHSVCLADGHAVATDSYRLIAAAIQATPPRPLLLPTELVKVLPADGVTLTIGADAVGWPGGRSRLVVGDYPHWQGLMPGHGPAPLVLDRGAFLSAVLRADAVISSVNRYGATPIILKPVPGGISLGAQDQGKGLFSDEVGRTDAGADPDPIACNARFLAAALASIDAPRIRLSLYSPLKPFLITADSDDADTFRNLLMPVRIS